MRHEIHGLTLAIMSLTELRAEIPYENVETTDDALLELGVEGWTLLQDAIGLRAWIVGIFSTEIEARRQWDLLRPLVSAPGEAVCRALDDCDWRDSYKAHFKASTFGRLHWVPIWERKTYSLGPGETALWLDPGMAFGTGNHETTRLCCERLVRFAGETASAGHRVIDAGCGSGILALSAARLGFVSVVGFDNDPEAVHVSQENAKLNGLADKVNFFVGDLVSGLSGRQAEVVLANIQADVLMRFVPELIGAVAPGGLLVLSGILARECDQVRAVFAEAAPAPGWRVESRTMGEWSDLALFKTP